MVKEYKKENVRNLIEKLNEKKNIILTNYTGIKVHELGDLRNKLKEVGADYKVVKNNMFRIALNEAGYDLDDEYLKGPIAVAFTGDDLTGVAKILKDFKKDQNHFSYSIGIMDNDIYDNKLLTKLADLPSKEVLLAKILYLINGPASGIAMALNQVISSLARGINAVAEKNGN